MNDGKHDPAGRFWAGTVADDEAPGAGAVYRLDPDGSVTRYIQGATISNGIDWSLDARTMYFINSATELLDAFDLAAGRLANRRVAFAVQGGVPDGLSIDAVGNLWVALWGTGEVRWDVYVTSAGRGHHRLAER